MTSNRQLDSVRRDARTVLPGLILIGLLYLVEALPSIEVGSVDADCKRNDDPPLAGRARAPGSIPRTKVRGASDCVMCGQASVVLVLGRQLSRNAGQSRDLTFPLWPKQADPARFIHGPSLAGAIAELEVNVVFDFARRIRR